MEKEDIINYIKLMLEPNKAGVCRKIMEQAESRYPQHFVEDSDGRHPYDTNYNERQAYYDGMELAYQDILEKLLKKKKL